MDGSLTRSRAYRGNADLRLMQALVADLWRTQAPFVEHHIGDLPWQLYQHLNKLNEVRIRLWLAGDSAIAWGWHWLKDDALSFEVHPAHIDLVDELVAWADTREVWTIDRQPAICGRVEALGYRRADDAWYEHHVRDLAAKVEDPVLPAGYGVRTVRAGDLARRVAVHRAAFAPSRVVPRSYGRVMRAWPYRMDLDHVIEAADGTFAAFCLAWLDEANGVGLLEPVGTHPDHRRRGLAAAVCSAALGALRASGATLAIVDSVGGSPATALYESIGMHPAARHLVFRRSTAVSG